MKNGLQVYDSDTHMDPAAEVLDKYVDPDFRPRLPELAPWHVPAGQGVEGPRNVHTYRAGTKYYRRVLGEEAPRETFTGRDSKWMGSKRPRPGIQDDNAENRVKDMDDEGTDAHFLIPTSWLSLVGVDDDSIEVAMIRAFHRHMEDFCAPSLRMGVLECGFGWLPFWGRRMDEQAIYVGRTAPLKLKPSEYMMSGRFFCGIEHHEGEDMLEHVTKFLGDEVLMYASDYPHSECQFPDSVSNILEWSSLTQDRQRKLFWGNANRLFRRR